MLLEERRERQSQDIDQPQSSCLHHKKQRNSPKKLKKQSSRVSLAIERSFIQSNSQASTDASQDFRDNYTSVISENIKKTVSLVYITVYLVIGSGVKPISFLMNASSKIDLVLIKTITLFNALFEQEHTLFMLKDDPTLFAFKPSKKTGFPKVDMPNINLDISLKESTYTQFSLVLNSNPEDYQYYFNKVEEVRPKGICERCAIF